MVVESVAAGASVADAARRAGVRDETLKGWLARGRREHLGPFAVFAADVADARRQAQQSPGQMSAHEWREHVERAVRGGSVAAMKVWADRFLIPLEELPEVPVSAITRLAQRRSHPDGAA